MINFSRLLLATILIPQGERSIAIDNNYNFFHSLSQDIHATTLNDFKFKKKIQKSCEKSAIETDDI